MLAALFTISCFNWIISFHGVPFLECGTKFAEAFIQLRIENVKKMREKGEKYE
jgi:hypothetical protein